MAELDDNIINLGEYFTDKAAQMFKGVLAEQNKNISALTKAVGKFDASQKYSPKKQDTTLSKDLKKIQDENRKLMAQNRNESLKLSIMAKDLKKQEIEMKKSSFRDKQQFKFLNSMAYTPEQFNKADKIREQKRQSKQSKAMEGLMAYTPEQYNKLDSLNRSIGQSKLDRINKQIQMARYNSVTRFNGQEDFSKDSKATSYKGLKSKYFHNMSNTSILASGAIPIDWKPQDKFQKIQIGLLGNILNSTKGMFVLTKKQQKSWDKFSKDFGKNMAAGIASSVSTVATPLLKDAATIGYIKLAKGFISQGKTPEEQKNRRNIAVIGIATVLPMVQAMMGNQYIMGRLTEEGAKGVLKLGKMGLGKLGLGQGTMGLGKVPLLAAVTTYAMGAWGAYTGFKRGQKEGGLGEGLMRGGTNFFTSIGKSWLQVGGMLGLNNIKGYKKFTSGITDVGIESTVKNIGKIIKLSIQLGIVELKNYFDNLFKKFNLFDMLKGAIIAAWKWIKTGGERWVKNIHRYVDPSIQKAREAAQKAAQKTKEYAHPAINELKRVGIHAKEIYQKGKDYFSPKDVAKIAKTNAQTTNTAGHCLAAVSKVLYGTGKANLYGAMGTKQAIPLMEKTKGYKEIIVPPHSPQQLSKMTEGTVMMTPQSKEHPYGHSRIYLGNNQEASDKIRPLVADSNYPTYAFVPEPPKQTKSPTRSINSSNNYDPTKNKETMTAVLNSYSK